MSTRPVAVDVLECFGTHVHNECSRAVGAAAVGGDGRTAQRLATLLLQAAAADAHQVEAARRFDSLVDRLNQGGAMLSATERLDCLVEGGFDHDTDGAEASRVSIAAEKASRPLGFSYRPRRKGVALDELPRTKRHRRETESCGPELNTMLRCVEPTRRVQLGDDVNLHAAPHRALFAAADDVLTSEHYHLRNTASLLAHALEYGTLRGAPPRCYGALWRAATRRGIPVDLDQHHDDAVRALAGELAASTAIFPRIAASARQMRQAARSGRAESADLDPATACANGVPRAATSSTLRHLPFPVILKHPLPCRVGTALGAHTHTDVPAPLLLSLLRHVLVPPPPSCERPSAGIVFGVLLPLLAPPAHVDSTLGVGAGNQFAELLAVHPSQADGGSTPTHALELCVEEAPADDVDGEHFWPLTPPLAVCMEAFLMLCRELERHHVFACGSATATLASVILNNPRPSSSGGSMGAAAPPKLDPAVEDRVAALDKLGKKALEHAPTQVLLQTLASLRRSSSGLLQPRAALRFGCRMTDHTMAHLHDVVLADKGPLVAMVCEPDRGTLRFLPVSRYLRPTS